MMIDTHAHLIPGIDDGAQSMEDMIMMAEIAVESGVEAIIATPHSNQAGRFENFYGEDLVRRFEEVQAVLKEETIPLRLFMGMEIFSLEDTADKIRQGKLIGLNHSRYYLMEFDFEESPDYIEKLLNSVLDLGKIPVIAHPERYRCIQRSPWRIYDWMRRGCLSQVNRGSILGRFGREAAQAARTLLHYNWVSMIASDAHGCIRRTPYLEDVQEWMEEKYGMEYAEAMLELHPRAVLEDRPVPFYGYSPE